MAGTNARHAASTLNTTCLASATQKINATKITIRNRKNPAPCGSNTRISSPTVASGIVVVPNPGQAIPADCCMITCANVRAVTLSSPGEHVKRAFGPVQPTLFSRHCSADTVQPTLFGGGGGI